MTEDVAATTADRIQIASTETENLLGELRRIGVLGNDIPPPPLRIDNRQQTVFPRSFSVEVRILNPVGLFRVVSMRKSPR